MCLCMQMQQATRIWLLSNIRPDVILSGHTHEYSERTHAFEGRQVTEFTVPTISYRMGTSNMGVRLIGNAQRLPVLTIQSCRGISIGF